MGDGMFGSKKGPETVQKSTVTTKTGQQQELISKMIELYGPTLGAGEAVFPGEDVAGLTPAQQKAIGTAGQFMDVFGPMRDIPLLGEAETALGPIISGEAGPQPLSTERAADVFSRIGEEPRWRTFKEETAPIIREEFAGPGFWSSARAQAVGKEATELGRDIGESREEFMWGVEQYNRQLEQQNIQNQMQAMGMVPELAGLPTQLNILRLSGIGAAYGLSTEEQAQKQREINAQVNRFAAEQRITGSENLAILQALAELSIITTGKQVAYEITPSWKTGDWIEFGTKALLSA